MEIGETWAYRARRQDPLAEVRIEHFGEKRPLRVKVRFEADEDEGRVEWVPPSHLKSPWMQRSEYLDQETRMQAFLAPFQGRLEIEDDTSQHVFDGHIDWNIVRRLHGRLAGVTEVRSWEGLELIAGLSRDELGIGERFPGQEYDWLAWPAAVVIAKAHVQNIAETALLDIDKEIEKEQDEAARGTFIRGGRNEPDRYFPERFGGYLEQLFRIRATLRHWVGVEPVSRAAEIQALRASLLDTTAKLNEAIYALVETGNAESAWPLHSWLYPDASKKTWRSMVKLEKDAKEAAWQKWLQILHRREFAIQVQTEISTSMLYGQEPARWAWSERIETAD